MSYRLLKSLGCLVFLVVCRGFSHRQAMPRIKFFRKSAGNKIWMNCKQKFEWWPTDAKPGPVKDEERGSYWWMPTEPGAARPWE